MSSRGIAENKQLQERLEQQVLRLIQQLSDLEECKDDLEPEEYDESKRETLSQLEEINQSLSKMLAGNMTLVDQLGTIQLGIQAAISDAFQTPSVIKSFIKKEPDQLRQRLAQIDRDLKLNKINQEQGNTQKIQILTALKQMKETLNPSEVALLQSNTLSSLNYVQVDSNTTTCESTLEIVGSQVRSSNQEN